MGSKKTSRRKAEKLRRKYDEAQHPEVLADIDSDFIEVSGEAAQRMLQFLTSPLVAEEPSDLDATSLGGADLAPRFQVMKWNGEQHAVHDALTGFFAVAPGASEATSVANALTSGRVLLESFGWTHWATDAEVFVTSANEAMRYHLLEHQESGLAVLDRDSGLIKVFDEPQHFDLAEQWVGDLNAGTYEFAADSWITPNQWVAPPKPDDTPELFVADPTPFETPDIPPVQLPEEDPEQTAAAHETNDLPTVRVLVVSSRAWGWKGIVADLIQTYWNSVGNPPITILTSGSPYGGEAIAASLAGTVPGVAHQQIRDEDVARSGIDYAFAFITNKSRGAEAVLKLVKRAGIPVHIVRETSADVVDPWLDR